MAVLVKGGLTNKIEFKYKTPGLTEGAIVTGVSILAYILYIVICAKKKILGPKLKLKKSYKVAAVGSADELGEKYKNLTLGKRPMKRRPVVQVEQDTDTATESETENETETENDTITEAEKAPQTETEAETPETEKTTEESESVTENENTEEEKTDSALEKQETAGDDSQSSQA